MQNHNVKTHQPNRSYTTPHLFVLSKGNNAGKPMDHPCPNCFVITTVTTEERDRLYWLCFSLWKSRHFYQQLVGSVIPFLRIKDLQDGLITAKHQIDDNWEDLNKTIEAVNGLTLMQDRLNRQLTLIAELKITLLQKQLKRFSQ